MEPINEKDIENFKVGDYILFDNGDKDDSREIVFIVEEIFTTLLQNKKVGKNAIGNMIILRDGEIFSTSGMKFDLIYNFISKERNVSKLNKKEKEEYKNKLFLETL